MKYLIFCLIFIFLAIQFQHKKPRRRLLPDTTAGNQRSVVIGLRQSSKCVIAGLTVTGVNYLNPDQILSLTGLAIGDTISIPGEESRQL